MNWLRMKWIIKWTIGVFMFQGVYGALLAIDLNVDVRESVCLLNDRLIVIAIDDRLLLLLFVDEAKLLRANVDD
ncbi:hypothetical protein DERP_004944 [Dermatophagoides pteronyssinus]|uniref:Secreted protein n=1 Tax=Dermatophagoides pteronyssinus TaxID=6956 RepID=A0ABQ8JTV6_DERPT|nr:hypothetical protein DERP_004944 [Dermatophagoides pteronyssinus]